MSKHTGSSWPSSLTGVNWSMLYLAKALNGKDTDKHGTLFIRQDSLRCVWVPPFPVLIISEYKITEKTSLVYLPVKECKICCITCRNNYCNTASLRRLSSLRRTRTSKEIKDDTKNFRVIKHNIVGNYFLNCGSSKKFVTSYHWKRRWTLPGEHESQRW